ncbi:MAG: DUF2335 domain-containing protein, partial [Candidatus Eisenbacteria bacterium]
KDPVWTVDPAECDANAIFTDFRAVGMDIMTTCSLYEAEIGRRPDGSFASHAALPPLAMLERYELAFPGSAERILTLAESQQRIRHRAEESAIRAALASERRGQWTAFILLLAGMGTGVWLTRSGHGVSGLISSLIPLGAVAGAFLHSQARREKTRLWKGNALQRAQTGPPA